MAPLRGDEDTLSSGAISRGDVDCKKFLRARKKEREDFFTFRNMLVKEMEKRCQ